VLVCSFAAHFKRGAALLPAPFGRSRCLTLPVCHYLVPVPRTRLVWFPLLTFTCGLVNRELPYLRAPFLHTVHCAPLLTDAHIPDVIFLRFYSARRFWLLAPGRFGLPGLIQHWLIPGSEFTTGLFQHGLYEHAGLNRLPLVGSPSWLVLDDLTVLATALTTTALQLPFTVPLLPRVTVYVVPVAGSSRYSGQLRLPRFALTFFDGRVLVDTTPLRTNAEHRFCRSSSRFVHRS